MTAAMTFTKTDRYAKCIDVSKRVRWDIDRDVIRGRTLDFSRKFLPDGLTRMDAMNFLSADDKRFLSQIQGRTYANMFGLVERFICAKILEISRDHVLGDQTALEALVRFSDEELKHQELFRRLGKMTAAGMPAGYQFLPQPNDVAHVVLGKSTWAVLGLTLHIELFTQAHYKQSIDPDTHLSELWKDVFLYHWKEESQHAVMDELEWIREDARLTPAERDNAVNDLIALVAAVDGILDAQSKADADYFARVSKRSFTAEQIEQIRAAMFRAYRWQYIVSGVQEPRFNQVLGQLITLDQGGRIASALGPILN